MNIPTATAKKRVVQAAVVAAAIALVAWGWCHSNELVFRAEFWVASRQARWKEDCLGERAIDAARRCKTVDEGRFVEQYCVLAIANFGRDPMGREEAGVGWDVLGNLDHELLPETRDSLRTLMRNQNSSQVIRTDIEAFFFHLSKRRGQKLEIVPALTEAKL
ncbi:MAG: hypothetical protein NT069_02280 [Planctomycetota bacterium]|nr:hypothetical protein [Planctomycetota bacterium]